MNGKTLHRRCLRIQIRMEDDDDDVVDDVVVVGQTNTRIPTIYIYKKMEDGLF